MYHNTLFRIPSKVLCLSGKWYSPSSFIEVDLIEVVFPGYFTELANMQEKLNKGQHSVWLSVFSFITGLHHPREPFMETETFIHYL